MGTKANYIFSHIEVIDNKNKTEELNALLLNRPFILLENITKTHCLWLKFIDSNQVWRSHTAIQNIDDSKINQFILKTRSEIFHIQKFK